MSVVLIGAASLGLLVVLLVVVRVLWPPLSVEELPNAERRVDPAPPPTRTAEHFWGRAHVRGKPPLHALAYYYRDPTAGPSMRIVVELDGTKTDAQIGDAARAARYLGDIFRLGAHEVVHQPSPEERGQLFDDPRSPISAVVVRLDDQERDALGLPAVPDWMKHYLR